ncbi:hypothetical protein [Amycolatopsis pittospori]|uniref:hypothetical protein n=1 Tax=Amycolatopsis pittospori TaxID=2749434 RepID=UPI001A9FA0BC|nr:hypothetical protein [Amycolatopsis pittospori]
MAMIAAEERVPQDTPDEVKKRAEAAPRIPVFDSTLGREGPGKTNGSRTEPRHRLVVIGDSLSHGFQSGAVFNTDLSYPAIIAHELGWAENYRYPRYPGHGGLPLNLELVLRTLEERFGSNISGWETPFALLEARTLMDKIEDHWERGPGSATPLVSAYNHCLSVYGWDLRDALRKTAKSCQEALVAPNDDLFGQIVENNSERAALRVYPHWSEETSKMTVFDAAAAMGEDRDEKQDAGIETLVVFLGANNALQAVTKLKVAWSGDDFQDLKKKNAYTVWRPDHFETELREVVKAVKAIKARHVIWCTVPHVTVAPIAHGIGGKVAPGSRYYPFYARPWVSDDEFDPARHRHLTEKQARAVDYAIDMYNEAITDSVLNARSGADGVKRDWHLLDVAGLLDRMASRRYITDPTARPEWWTPYPLPPQLKALSPAPDSRFITGDGQGGRASGGLFSLDGVHPTTVAYGIIAQEMITIMRRAGVEFRSPTGQPRQDPVTVDFDRLIRRDTLLTRPPQNLNSTLDILGWADETVGWVLRTIGFNVG